MSDKVMVDAGELARLQELGRLAAHALDAYVSTLHVQECTIRNPGIALAKGDERRMVEQLAADLRAAAALAPASSERAAAGERQYVLTVLDTDSNVYAIGIYGDMESAQQGAQADYQRVMLEMGEAAQAGALDWIPFHYSGDPVSFCAWGHAGDQYEVQPVGYHRPLAPAPAVAE